GVEPPQRRHALVRQAVRGLTLARKGYDRATRRPVVLHSSPGRLAKRAATRQWSGTEIHAPPRTARYSSLSSGAGEMTSRPPWTAGPLGFQMPRQKSRLLPAPPRSP